MSRMLLAIGFVVVGCVLAPGVGRAADDATEEAARELFASAFAQAIEAPTRIEALERVASDFHSTAWADDALWVLGEVAHLSGHPERAIAYRQKLVDEFSPPGLEEFTKGLPPYQGSDLQRVTHVLELTGKLHYRQGRRTLVYNPLPMVTHDQLARAFLTAGRYEEALEHYENARSLAPIGSLYEQVYDRSIEDVRQKLQVPQDTEVYIKNPAADETSGAPGEPAEPSPESPQQDNQEPTGAEDQ